MKTNYQKESMLDMIFEHRNKAYGAYALRSSYHSTIRQALMISLSAVLLLLFGKLLSDKLKGGQQNGIEHIVVVDPIPPVILPITPPIVPPATPAGQPPQSQASNTIRHTEMNVTADNQLTDSLPTQEQLQLADAGLTTNLNGKPNGISDGTGTEPIYIEPTPPVLQGPVRIAEVMPEFPGGEKALMKFLADHTEFPYREREMGIGGKVISEFTVNEDGRVSDIKILKSPSSGFDKEVNRVVKILPAFKPGMQQGRPVKVRYVLPFTFNVNDY